MKNMICFFSALLLWTGLFVQGASAEKVVQPEIDSEAAILIEAETGQVLYEKNAGEEMYPASITKIATAVFAIENGDLDETVIVSENATDAGGTTVFLEEGEQVPLKKLIKGMLINSGNDAGVAVAEHISGSVERFSTELNAFLENKVGIKNTNFKNPHGLFDDEHITTAEDMAKITQYAMQNETFMDIFSTKELVWDGKTWDTTIKTHHRILKGEFPYNGVTGGKNGFVSQSGFTLVTTAKRDGLSLIVVMLKANSDDAVYQDTIQLLDYGFENYQTSQIEKGTTFVVDDKTYTLSEPIKYTHSLNDKIRENVSEEGILTLEDDLTSSTFELDKVETQKDTSVKSFSTNDMSASTAFNIKPWLITVTLFIITICFITFLYLRRTKY